jgi:hypothetical protein
VPSFSTHLFRLSATLCLVLACEPRSRSTTEPETATAEATTSDIDAHLAELDDPARRGAALTDLRSLAFAADERGDAAEIDKLGAALLPTLAARWPEADGEERRTALTIALYLATAGTEVEALWTAALASATPEEVALIVAVDTLLAVQFRIPDVPGTLSIGERAMRAVGAIGEPALPAVLMTFAGNNPRLEELVAEVGVSEELIRLSTIRQLGVIGSSRATQPLLAAFPMAGCGKTPALRDGDAQIAAIQERAFIANALGYIADPSATTTLCGCVDSSNPMDLYEIVSALGRIGGAEAARCLETVMDRGRYDPDFVSDPAMAVEIRWEAVRWAIIATPPTGRQALARHIDALPKKVRAGVERDGLARGLATLDSCGEDLACHAEVLADPNRHPFERERAAFELARASTPGDTERAAAIAAGFATPDPDVRVNMAWLAAKVADGEACPGCIAALDEVMRAEELTKTALMQAAWITARQTIDKAHAGSAQP